MTLLSDAAMPYAASYVMLRKGNEVAFVLRSNTGWMNGYYGLTAGKVEEGESFVAAAIREVKEEAGVTVRPEQLKHVLTCHRKEPGEDYSWVDVVFEATEWEGDVVNAQSDEHSEIAWLDLNNLPENVIPSLRFMLDQIHMSATYSEYGWNVEKTD